MAGKEELLKYLNKIIPEDAELNIQLKVHNEGGGIREIRKMKDEMPIFKMIKDKKTYHIELSMDKEFNLLEG